MLQCSDASYVVNLPIQYLSRPIELGTKSQESRAKSQEPVISNENLVKGKTYSSQSHGSQLSIDRHQHEVALIQPRHCTVLVSLLMVLVPSLDEFRRYTSNVQAPNFRGTMLRFPKGLEEC